MWLEMHGTGDAITLGAVIMPDHIHWLFQLSDRLKLSRVVAKFKSGTRAALLAENTGWETNYWEHRLRPDDMAEAFGVYMFLNPYRAGIISTDLRWLHGFWPKEHRFEFFNGCDSTEAPPPAGLAGRAGHARPAGWGTETSP